MRVVYFAIGGFIGWYLGTQQEAKTRQIYGQLKAELNQVKAQLKERLVENEDLKMQVGIEEPLDLQD